MRPLLSQNAAHGHQPSRNYRRRTLAALSLFLVVVAVTQSLRWVFQQHCVVLSKVVMDGNSSAFTTDYEAGGSYSVFTQRVYDYDLFTIGGGSGGVRTSRWSATQFGAHVALAELPFAIVSSKHTQGGLGGTCVIRGCVPKKLLIYGSHFPEEFEDAVGYGWPVRSRFSKQPNWGRLVDAKNKEVQRLNGIYRRLLNGSGVEIHEGYARVVGPHEVEVDGKRFTAKYICVATGSRAVVPLIPGADLPGVITSDKALALAAKPKRIVIIGGGYIALEFAGFFNGYGTEVHVVIRRDLPLNGFDEDVRSHICELMRARGIHLHLGESPSSISRVGRRKLKLATNKGTELVVDNVLFATGRKANSDDLGLEQVGVVIDPEWGTITVDAYSKTSVDSIYAIGDVTGRVALTPVALMEGMSLAAHLFGERPTKPDYEGVPKAVFSQPEIATCGLTETAAAELYGSVDVFMTTFRPLKHTMPTGRGDQERILLKMIVVSDGFDAAGLVVGLHMVGADAAEMMQGLAVAMKAGATKAVFDATISIHPTSAEEWVTMRTKTRTTTAEGVKNES